MKPMQAHAIPCPLPLLTKSFYSLPRVFTKLYKLYSLVTPYVRWTGVWWGGGAVGQGYMLSTEQNYH